MFVQGVGKCYTLMKWKSTLELILCFTLLIAHCTQQAQLQEFKKKLDEDTGIMEGFEEDKKRTVRDTEELKMRIEQLTADNDKLQKSKKKVESEISDLSIELENQRGSHTALEKRQRKFDQNLAEEKAISER